MRRVRRRRAGGYDVTSPCFARAQMNDPLREDEEVVLIGCQLEGGHLYQHFASGQFVGHTCTSECKPEGHIRHVARVVTWALTWYEEALDEPQ
jgi:hypothetical protein